MASEAVLLRNDTNFASEIANTTVPVLVDFWAEWCGPCRMLGPILDQLAAEKGDAIKVIKVNVDESPALSAQYGVRSIPMLLFIKDGEVKTACQKACPSNAIVFGDVNDETSEIYKLVNSDRAYGLIEEIQVLPSVQYLVKVRNNDKNQA
jgi:thioredoxin 1